MSAVRCVLVWRPRLVWLARPRGAVRTWKGAVAMAVFDRPRPPPRQVRLFLGCGGDRGTVHFGGAGVGGHRDCDCPGRGYPYGMAITPDGTHAYITKYSSGAVSVIAIEQASILTGTPAATVAVTAGAGWTDSHTETAVLSGAPPPQDGSNSRSPRRAASVSPLSCRWPLRSPTPHRPLPVHSGPSAR